MFYGWRVLAALCAIYFLSVGVVFYSFAVVLPTMIIDLSWSRGGASVGHAIFGIAFGIGSMLAAIVLSKIGARWTIVVGGILSAIGSIVIYFTSNLPQFYLGIAIVGVGISLQSVVPGTQLLANWFTRRRAISMGLFLSMGGLGAFLAAPGVAYIIETTGQWTSAWLITTASALIGSVVAAFFVRNHPADMGTFSDGVAPSSDSSDTSNTISAITSDTAEGAQGLTAEAKVYQTKIDWNAKEAFSTFALWAIIFAFTMANIGLALNASQSVIHLLDQGLSPIVAGSAIGIVGLFSTGGRLFAGATGDRLDPRYLLAGGLFIELVGILLLNYTTTETLVYAYSILFGIGNGATIVALPALVANYYGATHFAQTIGIVHLLVTPFGAAASVTAGYLFDFTESYTGVFLGFSAAALIPVIIILMMKPPIHEQQTEQDNNRQGSGNNITTGNTSMAS
ncbi:MAG: MFS transporter [Pseudomonadales bacterium]|nr:MFS transporter [Pseudomonadales bacterium]